MKSAVIAVTLGISALLVAGVAGGGHDAPVIGRFQIACTSTHCYLVDTATGQVWTSGEPGFRAPKLGGTPTVATTEAQVFIGRWVSDDPNSNDVALHIRPGGLASATDSSLRFEGRWAIEGTHLVLTIDDEMLVAELLPDGRLSVKEEGGEGDGIVLARAPGSAVEAPEPNAFVGRWVSDDLNEADLGLRIEPEGRAVGTEGDREYEGRWRLNGTRIMLTIDDETLAGELQPDGRLLLWEPGDEEKRIAFKRAP